MMNKEKTQKPTTKYQDDDQMFSDDNMGDEGRTSSDAEEKRLKKAAAGSGKRGAAAGSVGGNGGARCQAEKCSVDLTEVKRYHRRHKVCEFHAKAPFALVCGLKQRFCQQCSRFHELSEFDEAKRSCRRRLAGHNERRRKASSEPQGEGGGSSSRAKAGASNPNPNPQCRPTDHVANRVQTTSYPTSSPTYKHYQIR